MEEKKCPECGGLNNGHSNRRCSLMTLEYAQQEIINVEQKYIKIVAIMNKNKDAVFNRLKKLIHFNQGKAAILKVENNKLRKQIKAQPRAVWVKANAEDRTRWGMHAARYINDNDGLKYTGAAFVEHHSITFYSHILGELKFGKHQLDLVNLFLLDESGTAAGREEDAAFAMLNYIQDELFRGSDRINGILVEDIYRAFKQQKEK